MADFADIASDLEEVHNRCAAQVRKPIEPRSGSCLWCDDRCSGAYCSPECRDDHSQWKRRQN